MNNDHSPPGDGIIEDQPEPTPPAPAQQEEATAQRPNERPRSRDLPTAMVAGVRLRPGGRVITCNAAGHGLRVGMRVMVQVERGNEMGIVTVAPRERPVRGRISRITRVADERDQSRSRADGDRAADALMAAREIAAQLKLAIKMFHAEVSENGRATLYFASDARVELRDLARDLGNRLRLRVELRQVGVRDEAKMVGGIGSCGRELCCSTFLPRFAPVSIKAAKVQNIALTPSKVSGQCGRLKCCLVYEEANYVEAAKSLPRMGKRVETPDGIGRVGDLDVLRGRVRVLFQDGPPKVYEGSEVKQASPLPNGPGNGAGNNDGR